MDIKSFIILLFFILFLLPGLTTAARTVDINTAGLEELDTLTGIGPMIGQRIIDARPFSSVDDLDKVKGIGEKTLQKIKEQGLACVACATQEISNSQFPISNTIYPSGIFINEIMPNPKGPDETDEWIKLYNSNNFDVDLSGWQIQDTVGTVTTYTILPNTQISANGFLVFKRSGTKIMLNNDKDGLNLLTPDKNIVDSMAFISAPLNRSYKKTASGWQWSAETKDNPPADKKVLSNIENSVKNNNIEAGMANISQTANKNPWFLFLVALAITIISAAIVLFIKLKIFKNHVRT